MLKKIADRILRSPAVAEGVVEAKSAEDLQLGIADFVGSLPNIDTGEIKPLEPSPGNRKETDGKPADKPGGTDGTGVDPNAANAAKRAAEEAAARDAAAKSADESAKAAEAKRLAESKAKEESDKKTAEEAAKKDKVEPGQEKWPRNSSDWDKYKKVHAEKEAKLQAEIDTWKGKAAELEAAKKAAEEGATKSAEPSPEVTAELERVKKANEEMSRRLQILDVTQHPQFQAYFDNKVNAQKELGKRIVGAEKAPQFEKLLALPDGDYKNSQIEEFVSDLPILQQSRIGAVLNALEGIGQEKAAEIAKAGEHKAQLTKEQEVKSAERVKLRDKLVNEVAASLASEKEGMAIFQKRTDDAEWNRGVDERIALAKKVITGEGMKPADVIKTAFYGAAVPAILQAYQSDMKEKDEAIGKLEEQVKALTAAQPGKGGSATAPAGSDTPPRTEIRPGMNPMDATSAWTKNLPGWGSE